MHVHPHGISHFHTHTHLHTRSSRYFQGPAIARPRYRRSPQPPNTAGGRPRRPSYPTRQAVCTRIKSRQQSLWITTVHRSVIIVTYATIAARTYTTKDARAGCPVGMTGTKKLPGAGSPPRAVIGRSPRPWLPRGRPRRGAGRRGRSAPR